jgi:hypothetical protein
MQQTSLDALFGLLLLLLSIQGSCAIAGLILLDRSRKREMS